MDEKILFEAALQIQDPELRREFLSHACRGNDPLRLRVEALLQADAEASGFLAGPAALPADTLPVPPREGQTTSPVQLIPEDQPTGAFQPLVDNIIIDGKYKLREELGEGGMGKVYVAESQKEVRRQVALKIIRPGYDSKSIRARFEQERQALANMNHPNIAQFIDAGTMKTGEPYFVMELIKGLPITRFCDEQRLTINERLELFIPVCRAVQHAHSKGIIHRDLKPNNILVGLYDGKPVPKIIDFGVSKATKLPLTDKSIYTMTGSVVGTLEYMAPEQAELNNLDIDTRADIYSLGVVLYELLTGTVPFSRSRLEHHAMLEMLRVIKEVEPEKPSTKVSGSGSLPSIAACRKMEPGALTRKMQGELDWIIMKCLEKERQRRYDGPVFLAQDLENYLADLPVQAGPPSTWYRWTKFYHRNRAAMLGAAALVLSLIGGVIGTTWGMVKAQRAEEVAKLEAAIAKATKDFVEQDVLQQMDPMMQAAGGFAVNKDIRLVTLLERSVNKLKNPELQAQPLLLASLETTYGRAFLSMGMLNEAKEHVERAVQLRKAHLPANHRELLETEFWLGRTLVGQTQYKEAQPLLTRVIDSARALELADLEHQCRHVLAQCQQRQGNHGEALSLYRQNHVYYTTKHSPTDHRAFMSLVGIAGCQQDSRDYGEAEKTYLEAIRQMKQALTPDHPTLLACMSNLCLMYAYRTKEHAKAQALFTELLAAGKEHYPEDHPTYLMWLNNFAGALFSSGNIEGALVQYLRLHAIAKKKLGPDHEHTLVYLSNVASMYVRLKRYTDAEDAFMEVHRHLVARYGKSHIKVAPSHRNLSYLYEEQKQFEKADPYVVGAWECIQNWKDAQPKDKYIDALYVAHSKLRIKQLAEAQQFLDKAAEYQDGKLIPAYQRGYHHRLQAELHARHEKWTEAATAYRQAAEWVMKDPDVQKKNSFAAQERADLANSLQTYLTTHPDPSLEPLRKTLSTSSP
jgi:serine/threonine protein kinase